MQHQCQHTCKTQSSSPGVGDYWCCMCNTNANTYSRLQDSIIKSQCGGLYMQHQCQHTYCIFQVGCPRLLEMGGVISLYKPTTTLQPKVLGFVRCTLSHSLFPKAMDNQPEKYSTRLDHQVLVWGTIYATPMPIHTHTYQGFIQDF